MDQERVYRATVEKAKLTLEWLFKCATYLVREVRDHQNYQKAHKSYTGETSLKKFLETNTHKNVQELAVSPLHMDRLKTYLNEQGIGFHVKEVGDKYQVYFESKNTKLFEAALKDTIEDLTKNPDKVKDLVKKDYELTPKEQMDRLAKTQTASLDLSAKNIDLGGKSR